MQITFTTEQTFPRADEVVSYLMGPRLWIPRMDYPDFEAWIDKVHRQLKSEEKRAILALSRGTIVGAVLYQQHKTEPDTLEVKNITVRPDMQGRYVASFLLRNAELESHADFRCHRVLVDAKARNTAVRAYLFKNGYRLQGFEDLYGLGAGDDVVYVKRLVGQVR